ncbi:Uncharacterized protein dnm_049300 [Desulfonema magnum]|uniref:Uncharacterized protein n=1 Tax=Desulfonema magnum TaxID=45655 RepID=A0A975BNR4_9BACT|nr:Uncharacterized protein dnm_049300 [Desulfonema magnum]
MAFPIILIIAKLQVWHSGRGTERSTELAVQLLPNCKFGTPDIACQTASLALRTTFF